MRILFLNPTGRMGGAEVALLEVLSGLSEARPSWPLGLIVASDGPLVLRARALGVDVRVLPFPAALARLGERSYDRRASSRVALAVTGLRSALPVRRYLSQLRAVVREFAPEIVHTNGLKMHVLGAWATPPGTALLWHLHDYVSGRTVSATLLKRYAHRCSAIVTNSQSVAEDVRRLGSGLPPIQTIWNAVDLARFSPGGPTLDLDRRASLPPPVSSPEAPVVRVGLVATFAVWKGHDTFLEALALLPPALNVRGYVIGGPVYQTGGSQTSYEALHQTADRFGLGTRVGLTGYVDDPAPAMRALDIVVHASRDREPFGLTIAEGMACGRAVVASLAGGAAEIVTPGVDALGFTPGDAGALAACLQTLASDPALRQQLGTAARATAERSFVRARLAGELLEVYGRLTRTPSLRVLHLHSGNLYGGVETFLATLAREAGEAPDMTPLFALCFEGRLSEELRALGHQPHMLGAVRVSRPHTIWRARRALARLLAELRVDVAVCHQPWPLAIFRATIRRAGLPVVLWMHTSGGDHWLDRWARRASPDLVIANSRYSRERLAPSFGETPVEIVYYPLRLTAPGRDHDTVRRDLRQSLNTPDADIAIVQAGRLDSMKGNREAIEALGRLRDIAGWTYWVVGGPQRAADEQYLAELQQAARQSGISDRVRFVGERDDVPALLAAADIYCQPNIRPEPFGIALVEAQAAGLPVVTSTGGGAMEIVDDSCGLLVPPGDVAALSSALRRLLLDAELRSRLGRAARDRSTQHCDLTRQMRRTSDVLSAAAGRRLPPAPSAVLDSSVHS